MSEEELKKISAIFIVGNGFDLSCGFKTCYKDYYDSKFFESSKKVIEEYFIKSNENNDDNDLYLKQRLILLHENKQLSIWDLFFSLQHKDDKGKVLWKDIENDMYNSFLNGTDPTNFSLIKNIWTFTQKMLFRNEPISFGDEEGKFFGYSPEITTYYLFHCASHLIKFIRETGNVKSFCDDYLTFLKDELIDFGNNFGQYILGQTSDDQEKKKIIKSMFKNIDEISLKNSLFYLLTIRICP